MDITLITEAAPDGEKLNIRDGMTLEELVKEQGPFKYDILLARVNGIDTELTEKLNEGDTVKLLDMRIQSANIAYQRGVTFIYLIAVREVFRKLGIEGADAEIDNSLNKGFFTRVRPVRGLTRKDQDAAQDVIQQLLTEEVVSRIEARMHELVAMNLPIRKSLVSIEEGVQIWSEGGYGEKVKLLEEVSDPDFMPAFYTIDVPTEDGPESYVNYFFGPMVPSTGYIRLFELRKYHKGILLRYPYYSSPDEIPEYVDDSKIYGAFSEEHRWLHLLGIRHLPDMNDLISQGGAKDTILLSEALHEKKIAEIADEIKGKKKRIILIAGPSSSGKTTFAKRLCIQMRVIGLRPIYMGTDDYFVNRDDMELDENGEKDYESLNAVDIDLFCSNMNDLLAGKEVDIPEFDFIKGEKIFGKRLTKIDKDQLIVIEGIHALNSKLTEQIPDETKFKIYISPLAQLNIDIHNRVPTTDVRMLRRMVRDYNFRGHSAAATIDGWPKVRGGEDKNIFPYNGAADVLFNSTLAYEIGLLKKYAEPLLEEITPDQPEYGEARRLLDFFRFFRTIENEKDVPNNSILREFIGGSVFVE
ncbi:MAG: nucleoside kinase [Clostridiales bacterium]|nr:nucleoside kinase [Clostridiales bacterium]